jgi:hypothetical protein
MLHNRCTQKSRSALIPESTRCEHQNETDSKDFFKPESSCECERGKCESEGSVRKCSIEHKMRVKHVFEHEGERIFEADFKEKEKLFL